MSVLRLIWKRPFPREGRLSVVYSNINLYTVKTYPNRSVFVQVSGCFSRHHARAQLSRNGLIGRIVDLSWSLYAGDDGATVIKFQGPTGAKEPSWAHRVPRLRAPLRLPCPERRPDAARRCWYPRGGRFESAELSTVEVRREPSAQWRPVVHECPSPDRPALPRQPARWWRKNQSS